MAIPQMNPTNTTGLQEAPRARAVGHGPPFLLGNIALSLTFAALLVQMPGVCPGGPARRWCQPQGRGPVRCLVAADPRVGPGARGR